ncbi:MAG: VOC family protein, partial [Acidimicrobiales bacterium]
PGGVEPLAGLGRPGPRRGAPVGWRASGAAAAPHPLEVAVPVVGLNHVVLYVRDAARSAQFYEQALGFVRKYADGKGRFVFLNAPASRNDHDLGLFTIGDAVDAEAGHGRVGLYHVSWETPTLRELAEIRARLLALGALVGESDHQVTKALYAKDPDGLEFEVTWAVPLDRYPEDPKPTVAPLDLDAAIAEFGADTIGGALTALPQDPERLRVGAPA